jgi:uncharacterized repeat protein (TIGR03803 family)
MKFQFPARLLFVCLAVLISNVWHVKAVDTSNGFTILHSFNQSTEGGRPMGGLILSGSTLYGAVATGGQNSDGAVFSISTNGANFDVLHSFSYGEGDEPDSSLALGGSTLYGVTLGGGPNAKGVLYSVSTDGTDFKIVHAFAGGSADGSSPIRNAPTLLGTKLYGTTIYGGQTNQGAFYSVNCDGTGFTVLHSFEGTASDGSGPAMGLTSIGSKLYGTTSRTIFSFDTANGLYTTVAQLGGVTTGELQVHGSTLYGMTSNWIYRINVDGSDYRILYSFPNDPHKPVWGCGGLTIVGSTLYGMSETDRDFDGRSEGTLFSMPIDGTTLTTLHNFTTVGSDAWDLYSRVTTDGSRLYGMTGSGGDYGSGTVFSVAIPEPSTIALLLTGSVGGLLWWCRQR